MARGRMINKRISISKKLANLKTDSARLLYFMCYPHTDVKGRLEADAPYIRSVCIPRLNWSDKKINACLKDLYRVRLILLYENNSNAYMEFTRFKEFQTLREDRESKSEIPDPPAKLPTNSNHTPTEVKLSKDNISKDKIRHLDFVLLTEEEHKKLLKKLGKNRTEEMIERLNNYIGSQGKKYKSHYFTILSWDRNDPDKEPTRKTKFFKAEDDNSKLTSKTKAKKFIKEITQDLKRIEDKRKVFNG